MRATSRKIYLNTQTYTGIFSWRISVITILGDLKASPLKRSNYHEEHTRRKNLTKK